MRIKLKVHANSSQEKILEKSGGEFEVWIREKPIGGKANTELIRLLHKYFKAEVKIKSGFTSRTKTVEVDN